jgi:hypothetical protein
MVRQSRSPVSNDKPKRSYLDKGPTKEQVERRNLLHGKLFGSDDGDALAEDDAYLFEMATATRDNHNDTATRDDRNDDNSRFKVNKRMSRSLSPAGLKNRVLGRVRRRGSTMKEGGDTAPAAAPAAGMRRTPRRNSMFTSTPIPAPTTNNNPVKKPITLLGPRSWSFSYRSRQRTKSADGLEGTSRHTKSADGLEDLRKASTLHQQEQQNGTGPDCPKLRARTLSENAMAEPSTMLERAARRVVERREKLRKAKADGDVLELLLEAKQKKAALEAVTNTDKSSANEEWIFTRGLQALEKMYDDVS